MVAKGSAAISTSAMVINAKDVQYVVYKDESQLGPIMALVDRDLSEPYSIFTYRYFLNGWPDLCFLALFGGQVVGTIVGKAEVENSVNKGYIAMLAVETSFRRLSIGNTLVSKAVERMMDRGCDEVFLETEVTNKAALRLYEKLGFAREERLLKYYLNGQDAFRLKLWLVRPRHHEGEEANGGGGDEEVRQASSSAPPPPAPSEGGRGGGKGRREVEVVAVGAPSPSPTCVSSDGHDGDDERDDDDDDDDDGDDAGRGDGGGGARPPRPDP